MIYQKPTKIEASLRYRCPNTSCGFDHWISLNESKVTKFKIVCDCGTVFGPKKISKLKVIYCNKHKINKTNNSIITDCITNIVQYGFTESEAKELLEKTYKKNPGVVDSIELTKLAIKNFGENTL